MFELLILQPSRAAATAENLASWYASNSREANKQQGSQQLQGRQERWKHQ
jgi:hypothetical protein